jgi:hypothetical protein
MRRSCYTPRDDGARSRAPGPLGGGDPWEQPQNTSSPGWVEYPPAFLSFVAVLVAFMVLPGMLIPKSRAFPRCEGARRHSVSWPAF